MEYEEERVGNSLYAHPLFMAWFKNPRITSSPCPQYPRMYVHYCAKGRDSLHRVYLLLTYNNMAPYSALDSPICPLGYLLSRSSLFSPSRSSFAEGSMLWGLWSFSQG